MTKLLVALRQRPFGIRLCALLWILLGFLNLGILLYYAIVGITMPFPPGSATNWGALSSEQGRADFTSLLGPSAQGPLVFIGIAFLILWMNRWVRYLIIALALYSVVVAAIVLSWNAWSWPGSFMVLSLIVLPAFGLVPGLATLYYHVFDRATVAAFKKAPAAPPDPSGPPKPF